MGLFLSRGPRSTTFSFSFFAFLAPFLLFDRAAGFLPPRPQDAIAVAQKKTGKRVWIPMHENLRALLAEIPCVSVTILMSSRQVPDVRWFSPRVDRPALEPYHGTS
jgi:hypothetical protein